MIQEIATDLWLAAQIQEPLFKQDWRPLPRKLQCGLMFLLSFKASPGFQTSFLKNKIVLKYSVLMEPFLQESQGSHLTDTK